MTTIDRNSFGGLVVCCLFLACAVSRAELVAHFRMDELAGATNLVEDSVGGAGAGAMINSNLVAREFASAPFKPAYDFQPEGALGGGANLGTNIAVRPLTNWTMTWWMQLDTLNVFDRLVESMDGTVTTSRGVRLDLGSAPGNHVRMLLRDGSGAQLSLQHVRELSTGTWYFVAARYDASGTATGKVTVINEADALGGTVVADNTRIATNGALGPIQYQAGRPTVLCVENTNGIAQNALDGQLDDVAFFDSVLGDDEVKCVRRFGAQTRLPTLAWDAADPGGQPVTRWQQNVGAACRWNLTDVTNRPAFAAVSSNCRITNALEFAQRGEAAISTTLPGRNEAMSIEIWLKPRDLDTADREVIFEAGGDANGLSLLLEGPFLTLRFDQDTVGDLNGTNYLAVAHALRTSDLCDFVQAVCVVDLAADSILLYVDGELAAQTATPNAGSAAGDMTSWAGGNSDHLGSLSAVDTSGVGGDDGEDLDAHTPFDGYIGVVRFYQGTVLTAEQVKANHEVMRVGSELPGTVLIVR